MLPCVLLTWVICVLVPSLAPRTVSFSVPFSLPYATYHCKLCGSVTVVIDYCVWLTFAYFQTVTVHRSYALPDIVNNTFNSHTQYPQICLISRGDSNWHRSLLKRYPYPCSTCYIKSLSWHKFWPTKVSFVWHLVCACVWMHLCTFVEICWICYNVHVVWLNKEDSDVQLGYQDFHLIS